MLFFLVFVFLLFFWFFGFRIFFVFMVFLVLNEPLPPPPPPPPPNRSVDALDRTPRGRALYPPDVIQLNNAASSIGLAFIASMISYLVCNKRRQSLSSLRIARALNDRGTADAQRFEDLLRRSLPAWAIEAFLGRVEMAAPARGVRSESSGIGIGIGIGNVNGNGNVNGTGKPKGSGNPKNISGGSGTSSGSINNKLLPVSEADLDATAMGMMLPGAAVGEPAAASGGGTRSRSGTVPEPDDTNDNNGNNGWGMSKVISREFPRAVCFQSDIVGFTQLSSKMSAVQVLRMIQDVATALDACAARHGVDKIGTVGDAYLAYRASGAPTADLCAVLAFAADAIAAVARLPSGVEIRIGVGTGPLSSGVLGTKMPMFRAWGEALHRAAALEAAGRPSRINVSSTTRAAAEAAGPARVKPAVLQHLI
jgi:class 3 adenylate cyclase